MEKENGRFDTMESKLHHGSARQKSRVPRTRLPQRYEYADAPVSDYRNGAVKKDHSSREYESHGMSTASLHLLADTDENKEWQRLIGERVCISGVKPGVLRYFGRTNFAQGYWCGIELDEPVGKNNGTVNGVVYFDCKPNHGIFAPVSKVSKLNDLNACTFRVDALPSRSLEPQHAHSNWDYNVGFLPNAQEIKFIKNSMSDPTSLKPKVRTSIPHSSQSFSYDARNITEKRRSESLGAKALRNYEISDLPSRHTKSFSGNSFNILNKVSFSNPSQQSSDKNRFLGSNVVRLTENRNEFDRIRASNLSSEEPKMSTAKDNMQNFSMEEYEQFLQTPTNSGQISPLPSEVKHFKDTSFFDYSKMPDNFLSSFQSLDYPDIEDELDNDDQMSVDFDESLGILTPSQMKDFTLCPDFPTTSSEMKCVDFPNSESFDDINELPEDEQVHDVSVQYVSETATNRNIEITKQSNAKYNNNFILTNDESKREKMFSSTNKFLSSISQKDYERIQVESRSIKSSGSCNSQVYERTHKLSNIESSTNYSMSAIDIEKEFRDKNVVSGSLPKSKTIELVGKSELDLVQDSFVHTSNNFRQYLMSSDQNKIAQMQHITERFDLPDDAKTKSNLTMIASEETCLKNYDTDSSRDSFSHGESENINLKEKLTVSWEDCIPHNSNAYTSVERPESVYTVGSSDTGFQEDGEIELDTNMATSMDSTEGTKRFSTASRDSCIVPDEVDCYKIAESNSTSGYSTGLSDSCSNDRPEDDLSSKPLTEEELQDSVGPCDSEDGFSFQENNSLSKDSEVVEMSDVTGETATVLCNDSTSEALCETMVEDTTLTEINELLSPEEAKSSNLSEKTENSDAPMEQSKETSDVADSSKTSEKAPSSTSTGSPAQSTPEKKLNRNKPGVDIQRKQPFNTSRASRTNRTSDDTLDKKQIVKSPKKNVMSKIKAMIEATSCKNNNKSKPEVSEPVTKRNVSVPKRSRWEAVTSKIAASLAEEKTKPKTKREIKSRVDTNLTSARQQVITCKSPKLGSSRNSNCGDGTMTPLSGTSRERKPLTERNNTMNLGREVRAAMTRDAKRNMKSPSPGKPCITSRSTSPVAASESSTTSVSVNSHNSRSKIAHWKGSTSTIASSVPPTAPATVIKRQTTSVPPKTTTQTSKMVNSRTVNKKPITVPKIRVTPSSSVRMRSPSPATSSKPERSAKHSRTSKEQTGVRGPPHSTKPVRPPMWLSKAELTQEIQRLGTLCEARTKELNRLKMETKHVSVGFDAFAALFKYMVEDLNALSIPVLTGDLEKTLKQLELAKQDLAYYEREVEEMKAHHSQELNDLSNKLFEVYQGEITELSTKHQEELNQLNYDHQMQIESLSAAMKASSDEVQAKYELMISQLKQELTTQREELQLFQDREIKDLEEKHAQATKTLQEHIEQLQKKCAELNKHSMSMEDAMRKDTDTKLQWVTSRKIDLEKEVESLKAVLEMKNKELHSLRVQTLEMGKQLEDLPLAREKIKMLQARAEDLEALMIEKTKVERKLSTENQMLKDTYEKESKVNRRLSMENEELQWRIRQAENSLLSGSFSEAAEYPENVENGTTSPVKSPVTPHLSRSVFFTFIDKDDSTSHSPRSQYKKITPGFATNYKTSPGKTNSASSPRRAKSHSEPPQPPTLSCTPRKTTKQFSSKQKSTPKRQRSGSDCSRSTSDHAEVHFFSVTGSMASSVSSESSVFEHKEQLLEEHEEQIIESLQILHEQRSVESPDEPLTPNTAEKEWCNGDAKDTSISPDFGNEDMSRSSEFSDPKTYYHMTFPVPKETGIVDCDAEDAAKNASEDSTPSQEEPANIVHSMSKSDLTQVFNTASLCSSEETSGNLNISIETDPGETIIANNMESTQSVSHIELEEQQRTI